MTSSHFRASCLVILMASASPRPAFAEPDSPGSCRVVVHLADDGLDHVLERHEAEQLLLDIALELYESDQGPGDRTPERDSPARRSVTPPAVRFRSTLPPG